VEQVKILLAALNVNRNDRFSGSPRILNRTGRQTEVKGLLSDYFQGGPAIVPTPGLNSQKADQSLGIPSKPLPMSRRIASGREGKSASPRRKSSTRSIMFRSNRTLTASLSTEGRPFDFLALSIDMMVL
jgi:hypothetical protein